MNPLHLRLKELYLLDIVSSQKATGGFLSENHVVYSTTKKYFLKKYRFDDKKRIEEIHAAKAYFADGGIPVILPLPYIELGRTKTLFTFEGWHYALFPFVEGRHIEREALSPASVASLGETLARIHLLGKDSKLAVSNGFKVASVDVALAKAESVLTEIRKIEKPNAFDRAALESVELKMGLIKSNTLVFEELGLSNDHLIHGDYLSHNVFFDPDGKVSHVFDFEKTGYAPRTYELFRSMFYSLLPASDISPKDIDMARAYLRAYSSTYPISSDEIVRGLKLFLLKAIHGFWVEGEHYLKSNSRVDHFLYDELGRIRYVSRNIDNLISLFS